MNKEFEFTPNGWFEKLVIETGASECGDEKAGLHIHVTKNRKYAAGGVIKREDMQKIIEIFSEHLSKYPVENGN